MVAVVLQCHLPGPFDVEVELPMVTAAGSCFYIPELQE